MKPNTAALKGFLFSLPFFVLNFIVSLRLEPFYSIFGSVPAIRNSPFIPLLLLLLFPVGAFVAALPMLQTGAKGKRKIYIANMAVAAVLLIIFVLLFSVLGEELYQCNVLKIPNCD
jgi:hypothetical protein